ncbi:Hsp20/alpha crystallin family protein [Taibaiella soli]|uniref:Hsp20/alpha crystallin family protein n=1 Tax=Taibaiella soli TaxID=1649169 RepID=A0A2W2B0Y3_9BACT|nr:Hsp20/alpha crystallin family protein [Taibaiella soli]PZF73658.1 Hsp20/alpha crystallin family protein [Taibaiella soli]
MYYRKNFQMNPQSLGGIIEDIFQNGLKAASEELKSDDRHFGHVPVNIHENEKGYELHVVAPGLKKEAFKINVEKNILTVSYDHKDESNEQAPKALRTEYRTRSFKRSFTLSEKADASHITAQYLDGILTVSIPKKENQEQPVQNITVA